MVALRIRPTREEFCRLATTHTVVPVWTELLAAGISDTLPNWAGGLPADAPPRPGSAKYDEFMRERERKRLEAPPPKDEAGAAASTSLGAIH